MMVGYGTRIIIEEVPSRGIYGPGILTAGYGGDLNIDFHAGAERDYDFRIDAVIGDYKEGGSIPLAVNLKVYGAHNEKSVLYLDGSTSNTYTGYTLVEGRGNEIALRKTGGAIAIQRDVTVSNQATLNFHGSNQLGSGVVTLRNHSWLNHYPPNPTADMSNKIRKLVVDGVGALSFGDLNKGSGKIWIYFDDIEIINDGWLEVFYWEYGRDFFLINKASANVDRILSRISFNGYDRNNIHLEDFSPDYWAIVAPEPATYGAVLGAVGLGLVIYRKCLHRMRRACGEKLGGADISFKGSFVLR